MPKKVILDVDTGSDDAVAIMAAMRSPQIELMAVTVTHGNQPLCYTLDNTLRVVSYMGGGVPVYAGSSEPMVKKLLPGRSQNGGQQDVQKMIKDGKEFSLHQKTLDLPEATCRAEEMPAAAYLVQALRHSTEKVTLIPVGPCTNIAMALRMDPSIVEYIEEIVCMGGGDNLGNRTAAAEFNFYADPEAAKIVLGCGAKVRILTLNATGSARFDWADAQKFLDLGTPAGEFAGQLIRHRLEFEEMKGNADTNGTAVHDALTVCAVIDPSVISCQKQIPCDIDIGGSISDGQLLCDHRATAKKDAPTSVAYTVDKERALAVLLAAMAER